MSKNNMSLLNKGLFMMKFVTIKRLLYQTLIYVILIVMSCIFIFPFYWLIRSSFMNSAEIFTLPMKWWPTHLQLGNFREALTIRPFNVYFRNTIFLVTLNLIANIFSNSYIAFGFSRINFRGRDFWFAMLLSTLMIPYSVILIPQFIGWKIVGAFDTFWPLTFPQFFGSAFYIFLLRQFYMGIPKEYDEAASVDGANYFYIYWKIILPLSKPALMTVGVFTFMNTWNDFFGPLIYLNSESKLTLALGLRSFMGQYVSQWNLLMAASTVTILPVIIVFFLAQRAFIEGITFSGLKG
ncbi:MAG: carbohydrate ABC transporter permease [Nitrososphaeria archaeon]